MLFMDTLTDRMARLRDVSERTRDNLDTARHKAGDLIATTRERGSATIDDTREQAQRAAQETSRVIQDNPIATIAMAAAAGAVFGALLPQIGLVSAAGKVARGAARTVRKGGPAQLVLSGLRDIGRLGRRSAPDLIEAADEPAADTNGAETAD